MRTIEPPFGNPATSQKEVRGFASPPHDGFALFGERARPTLWAFHLHVYYEGIMSLSGVCDDRWRPRECS